MKKLNVILMTLVMALTVLMPMAASAALTTNDVGIDMITNTIQLGNTDPRTTVAKLINAAMMFLGIIAVLIVLLGGFKWMTAMGNEEKVSEAKKLMGAGVIGLVIVLAAWGVATFVLGQLVAAT